MRGYRLTTALREKPEPQHDKTSFLSIDFFHFYFSLSLSSSSTLLLWYETFKPNSDIYISYIILQTTDE